jgi:GNAT superfamily N-acetyltransferase
MAIDPTHFEPHNSAGAFQIRRGTPADHTFVYSATARTLRSSPYYAGLPHDTYGVVIDEALRSRLAHPDWLLWIAFPTDRPTEVGGFILSNGLAVASIYVRSEFRRRGVGRMLLDAAGVAARPGDRVRAVLGSAKAFWLARQKGLAVQFSPYFI